jgi:hypothetical protein
MGDDMITITRNTLPLTILFVCGVHTSARAQAWDIQDCSSANQALVEEAAEFSYENRNHVFDEIDSVRANGNVHGYESISSAMRNRWINEIERARNGHVKFKCVSSLEDPCIVQTDASGQIVSVTFGETYSLIGDNIFDEVRLCPNNFGLIGGTPFSLGAHTISHELMHHVDGWGLFPHGPDGASNMQNPDSPSETIGVAMEHVALTPELRSSIAVGAVSSYDSSGHVRAFELTTENTSDYAAASTFAMSATQRNTNSVSCLTVDGTSGHNFAIPAVDINSSEADTYSIAFAYTAAAPYRTLDYVVDCTDVFLEFTESDNIATTVYSTYVDLDIDVDLASAPVLNSAYGTLYFTLTYDVTVTNTDNDTPASTFDVVMYYDDIWSGRSYVQTSQWVSSLAPSGSTTAQFSVDVLANATGTAPLGGSELYFVADGNAESLHDRDLSNNTVHLTVDSAYWRPDYRFASFEVSEAGLGLAEVQFSVVNAGPKAATRSSVAKILNPALVASFTIPALASTATSGKQRVTVPMAVAQCSSTSIAVVLDATARLVESDETNNTSSAIARTACLELVNWDALWGGRKLALTEEYLYNLDPEVLGQMESWMAYSARDMVDWYLQGSSNGPFLPTDWVTRYAHGFSSWENGTVVLTSVPSVNVLTLQDSAQVLMFSGSLWNHTATTVRSIVD